MDPFAPPPSDALLAVYQHELTRLRVAVLSKLLPEMGRFEVKQMDPADARLWDLVDAARAAGHTWRQLAAVWLASPELLKSRAADAAARRRTAGSPRRLVTT